MASTADTVQSSPSTDRPVYELLGQAEEVAAKQIAVFSSTNDGRFARATMGGVVCINQKDFGLTAWDDSDEDSNVGMLSALRNPPSMNRMLGYIDKILDNKWALIRLEARKRLQNIIRVPNSFGGGFVPTKIASIDLRPNCEVWIATGKGVVTGRSNPTPETPWAVELKSGDLGPEDRGSWAIDPTTKDILGIVVKIVQRRATLHPMRHVFDVIQEKFPGANRETFLSKWESQNQQASSNTQAEEMQPSRHRWNLAHHFRYSHSDIRFVKPTGHHVGTADSVKLWPFEVEDEREWQRLKDQLNSIIEQTPAKSAYGPSPTVALLGFVTGESREMASPTVLIISSSPKYAKRLKKEIARSKVAALTRYKVKVLNTPIRWV